jgi:protein transport protein SEC9
VIERESSLITLPEKLANTERHLDVSKGHQLRAEDKTDELKKLNRSIFRPAITFNKDAKRAAQEAKIQQRYEDDRQEREQAMMDIRETQNRLGRAATYGRGDEDEEGIGGGGGLRSRMKTEEQRAQQKAQRSRYQFEATQSDDDMEDELDDNLDEIGDAAKRLKAIGLAMGSELDNQVKRIDRISDKTGTLNVQVDRNTDRVCHGHMSWRIMLTYTVYS